MKLYFLLLIVLIGLPLVTASCTDSWYNGSSFKYRTELNLTSFVANQTVLYNMSGYCSNVNCTDVIVVDQNNATLTFLTPQFNGRYAFEMLAHNITNHNYPQNDMLAFIPQNLSTNFCIYSWNVAQRSTRTGFILWWDNFENYSISGNGLQPICPNFGTPCGADNTANAYLVKSNGQQGFFVTAGASLGRWNVTEYSNITYIMEVNKTEAAGNGMRIDLFGVNSGSYYRFPQEYITSAYCINVAGGGCLGSAITSVPSQVSPTNFTGQREGANIKFWYNNTIQGGNTTDTTTMRHSMIGFVPGITNKVLLDLKVWNITINNLKPISIDYTLGSTQLNPAANSCTPITPLWQLNLADNCTISGNYVISNIIFYSTGFGSSRFINLNLTYSNLTYGTFIQWATLTKDRNSILIKR